MMKDTRVEDSRIVGSPSEKTREVIRVRQQQQPEWFPESKLDMVKDPIPIVQSPSEKVSVRRPEWRPDSYLPPAEYIHEKRPMPMRPHRSLSPPPVQERSGRIIDGYRRGVSIERDEYDMQFYDDRDGNAFTRSPPFRQVRPHIDHEEVPVRQVRPHIDEEVSFRGRRIPREALNERRDKYTMQEYRDPYVHLKPKVKHFVGSGSSGTQYGHEKHLQGNERLLMPPQAVVSTLKSGRIGGTGPSSINLNIRPRNDEEFQYEENLRSDKFATKEFYKGEYAPQLYPDDVYDHVSGSSRKDFRSLPPGVSRENILEESSHSYGFSRRQGRYSDSGGQVEYNEDTYSNFARGPGIRQKDLTVYRDVPRSSARREPREEPREYSYHEHGRRDEDGARVRNELYREDEPNERGTYTRRVLLRPIVSGPVVDEVQYIESSRRIYRESTSRGHHPLQEERPPNYRNTKSSLLRADHDAEVFGSEINNSGMKLSREPERTRPVGDYGFGRDAGPLSQKERIKRLQLSECDPDIRRQDSIPQRRLKAEELNIYDPPERMLKRRYPVDEDMIRHGDRRIVVSDRITSRQTQELSDDEQWMTENTSESFSSKRLRYGHLQYGKSERPKEGRVTSRMSESDGWASHQDVPAHVQKRAVDHYTGDGNVNIKERLRPCPPTYHNSHNMGRKQDFYKSDRTWKRNKDNQYDPLLTDDDNPLEEMDAPVKPDLPEDSDEFKQLVENYFLQYSKLLNQKPSTQRRYREQGNAGFLLCIVCGRLSKEFQDTRSLVTHTFMSRKIGKRAQHFALNRAICVLMGWKSTITLTGACIYEVLPETEAWALKEDQILWPPFVIIHDSTVFKDSSETREVFTIEQMETILRGIGISGGKVRYGKPVNQSIMLVKFLPTFSGLQEAEKLHKYYSENTRGRGEFQNVKANSRNVRRDEQVEEEKTEKVLYGYMGIAEDLDKLDFDSKKKCQIKSKKEIYAIADAPLIKE